MRKTVRLTPKEAQQIERLSEEKNIPETQVMRAAMGKGLARIEAELAADKNKSAILFG